MVSFFYVLLGAALKIFDIIGEDLGDGLVLMKWWHRVAFLQNETFSRLRTKVEFEPRRIESQGGWTTKIRVPMSFDPSMLLGICLYTFRECLCSNGTRAPRLVVIDNCGYLCVPADAFLRRESNTPPKKLAQIA